MQQNIAVIFPRYLLVFRKNIDRTFHKNDEQWISSEWSSVIGWAQVRTVCSSTWITRCLHRQLRYVALLELLSLFSCCRKSSSVTMSINAVILSCNHAWTTDSPAFSTTNWHWFPPTSLLQQSQCKFCHHEKYIGQQRLEALVILKFYMLYLLFRNALILIHVRRVTNWLRSMTPASVQHHV